MKIGSGPGAPRAPPAWARGALQRRMTGSSPFRSLRHLSASYILTVMLIAPLKFSERADLARLMASYRVWMLANTDEVVYAAGIEAEIKDLRDSVRLPLGYHLAHSDNGDVVGCIAINIREDTAWISRLHAPRPGQGIGRALLEYAIQVSASQQVRCIELDTSINMLAAQHLYLSLGFLDVTSEHTGPEVGVVYFRLML
ncbi:GNAT family N-acetyltransferase [Thioclava sp. BHET1]|nr:GNAT family N-acetyltransferase [Thioclava sp. BHET1]